MFLYILELGKEYKKNCVGKTVLIMWSQICDKLPKLSVNILRKKLFQKFGLQSGKIGPLRNL